MPRALQLLTLLMVCLAGAAGCTIGATYNNLDRLARWQVSDYVDFDDRQDAFFRAELDRLLHWHRVSELPKYADRLERLAREVGQEYSEPALESLVQEVVAWAEAIESQAMPMTVELMLSLSDSQVAALPANFEHGNEEFMEDEVDADITEARERWVKSMQSGARYFLGAITREQRDYLVAQSVRYQPEQRLWVDYRRRWQADLLLALADRRDITRFAESYQRLVREREQYWGSEFTAVSRSNDALRRDVTLMLLRTAEDGQRSRLIGRLDDFVTEFRELAAQADSVPPPSGGCLVRCPGPG